MPSRSRRRISSASAPSQYRPLSSSRDQLRRTGRPHCLRRHSGTSRFGAAPGAELCAAYAGSHFGQRLDRCIAGQSPDPFTAHRLIFRAVGGCANDSGELALSRWGDCLDDLRAGIVGDLARLYAATLKSAAERSLKLFEGGGFAEQLVNRVQGFSYSLHFAAWAAPVLAIVYRGSGMRGPWVAMAGVMLMASLVGFSFGLVINSLSRIWIVAPIVSLPLFHSHDRSGWTALAGRGPCASVSLAAAHAFALGVRGLALDGSGCESPSARPMDGPTVPKIDIAEP